MPEPLSVPGPLAGQPGLVVRRPHPWKPLIPVVVLLGCLGGIVALFGDVSPTKQGKGAVVLALGLIALPFMLRRVWRALQLRQKGLGSYALSDQALLVVDAHGRSGLGVVALSSIARLHLAQWEVPVVAVRGTAQGAPAELEARLTMFSNNLSIGEILLQPASGARFFDELAARVRALDPKIPVTRWGPPGQGGPGAR
jgi:hypothetical protein